MGGNPGGGGPRDRQGRFLDVGFWVKFEDYESGMSALEPYQGNAEVEETYTQDQLPRELKAPVYPNGTVNNPHSSKTSSNEFDEPASTVSAQLLNEDQ